MEIYICNHAREHGRLRLCVRSGVFERWNLCVCVSVCDLVCDLVCVCVCTHGGGIGGCVSCCEPRRRAAGLGRHTNSVWMRGKPAEDDVNTFALHASQGHTGPDLSMSPRYLRPMPPVTCPFHRDLQDARFAPPELNLHL